MQRGEIWWADPPVTEGVRPGPPPAGADRSGRLFNASRIQTVIVAVITPNIDLAAAPGNLYLRKKDSSLPKDSVVNVSQLITVDKAFLTERVGRLTKRRSGVLDEGLRLVLGL